MQHGPGWRQGTKGGREAPGGGGNLLRPALVIAASGLLLGMTEASGQTVAVTALVAERVEPMPAQMEWVSGAGLRLMDGEVHTRAASPNRLLLDTQAEVRRREMPVGGGTRGTSAVRAVVERRGRGEVLIRLECVQELLDGDELVVTRVLASNS